MAYARYDDAAFDAAACNFGLSDIDDLDHAIAAVSAALRPGGRFVFSILHPCFGGGKDISGSWSPTSSYYDEGRWTAQDARSTLRRQLGANHRTLSTYLNMLRAHDLWLDQIAEPLPASTGIPPTTPTASQSIWSSVPSSRVSRACTPAPPTCCGRGLRRSNTANPGCLPVPSA